MLTAHSFSVSLFLARSDQIKAINYYFRCILNFDYLPVSHLCVLCVDRCGDLYSKSTHFKIIILIEMHIMLKADESGRSVHPF